MRESKRVQRWEATADVGEGVMREGAVVEGRLMVVESTRMGSVIAEVVPGI